MKDAKTNDVWRDLYRRQNYSINSLQLHYDDLVGLGTGTLTLPGPLVLLAGENGAGKSRFLRALANSLAAGPLFAPPARASDKALSAVSLSLRIDGQLIPVDLGETSAQALLTDEDGNRKVRIFEPTLQVPQLVLLIRSDRAFSDLLEGVEPKILSASEIGEVCYLVGRQYSDVRIFEITDYKDQKVTPYFVVTSGALTYGAEEMGTGELALLLLYWLVSQAERGSILLLEEPEAFIAPRSQRALIDWVALQVKTRDLFVVASTHSGIIAERVPNAHVVLLSRAGAVVTFLPDPPARLLVDRLGLRSPDLNLLFVEDNCARDFASALLEAVNSRRHAHTEIVVGGSTADISQIMQRIPVDQMGRLKVLGVHDGDQRKVVAQKNSATEVCLPIDEAPELVAQQLVHAHGAAWLALRLGRSQALVDAGIAGANGRDIHDWLRSFLDAVNVDRLEFFRQVSPIWIHDNSARVDAFLQDIGWQSRP